MLWFEFAAVLLMAIAGARIAARLKPRLWWCGVALPAVLLILIFLGHRIPWLSVFPPFSWLTDWNIEPPLVAGSIVLLFSTLITRLHSERVRALAAALAALVVAHQVVLPLAIPLAIRPVLADQVTRINPDGVCLQTQNYSCGPASAVTCLRGLGVHADEGAITIESRCKPPLGVDGPSLAAAISQLYEKEGIHAECRWVGSIDGLPRYSIASLQRAGLRGHAVAVLMVTPVSVILGDPAEGTYGLSRAAFMKLWTRVAVILTKDDVTSGLGRGE